MNATKKRRVWPIDLNTVGEGNRNLQLIYREERRGWKTWGSLKKNTRRVPIFFILFFSLFFVIFLYLFFFSNSSLGSGPEGDEVLWNTWGLYFVRLFVCSFVRAPFQASNQACQTSNQVSQALNQEYQASDQASQASQASNQPSQARPLRPRIRPVESHISPLRLLLDPLWPWVPSRQTG